MFEYIQGIKSMLEACAEIKPGERWLVIADNEGRSIWLGQLAMDIITQMGVETVLSIVNPPELETSGEPPRAIAEAMKNVNAILRIAEKNPYVHTNARKEATAVGVRYYVLKDIPLDDLKRGASPADISLIKERTENLAGRLAQTRVAKITTPRGTNISMNIANRTSLALNPLSHIVSSLPDYAEAAIAPVEGTAEGVIVADLAIIQWEYIFSEPLRYSVKAGKVTEVYGNTQDAEKFRKVISANENNSNIAELGIGTSHILPRVMRGNRRDCARIGTAHIAVGKNDDIGGKISSPIHLDCLMSNAVVELDGQCVLRDGKLIL